MIRPLRRRHSLMIAMLFFLLAIGAGLALTHPSPSARTDTLPTAIAGSPLARTP